MVSYATLDEIYDISMPWIPLTRHRCPENFARKFPVWGHQSTKFAEGKTIEIAYEIHDARLTHSLTPKFAAIRPWTNILYGHRSLRLNHRQIFLWIIDLCDCMTRASGNFRRHLFSPKNISLLFSGAKIWEKSERRKFFDGFSRLKEKKNWFMPKFLMFCYANIFR